MGVDPKIWGPHTWAALHLICEGAPNVLSNDIREHYVEFFNHLSHILPCEKCTHHLQKLLTRYPLDASVMTREHLIEWCIRLHNAVTKDIYPDAFDMPIGAARAHWDAVAQGKRPALTSCALSESVTNSYKSVTIVIAVVAIAAVTVFAFRLRHVRSKK